MNKIEVRAQMRPWNGGVEFMIYEGESICTNLIMETPSDPGLYIPPPLKLDPSEVQTLMDDLWYAGYRPTEGTGSAGALAATQNHLKDMQKLVFSDE